MTLTHLIPFKRALTATLGLSAALLLVACGGGGSEPADSNLGTGAVEKRQPGDSSSSATGDQLGQDDPADGEDLIDTENEPVEVAGDVELRWSVPVRRVNGEPLDRDELAGYELRFRESSESDYQHIFIDEPVQDVYRFDELEGTYEFQIAAVDTHGLYSSYISLTPFAQ